MAISGEQVGAVYFWDRIEAWEGIYGRSLFLAANSFDEFMQLLKRQDELDAEPLESDSS